MIMKIVISGATGYIGGYLLNHFKNHNKFNVIGASRTKEDNTIVKSNYVDALPPAEVLIHLGENSVISEDQSHGDQFVENQVNLAHNLCGTYSKIIYFSSASLYSDKGSRLSHPSDPIQEFNHYQRAKAAVEQVFKAGTDAVILRLANVYGSQPKKGTILFDILSQLNNKVVNLRSLNTYRDYIHLLDIASLMEKILDNHVAGTYNVGSGCCICSEDLAKAILECLELRIPVRGERISDVSKIALDISSTVETFKWSPIWDIKQGVKEICKNWRHY